MTEKPRAQKLAFERDYSDGSGVEKAVRFNGKEWTVELENAACVSSFDISDLDWLIACLQRIKEEVERE